MSHGARAAAPAAAVDSGVRGESLVVPPDDPRRASADRTPRRASIGRLVEGVFLACVIVPAARWLPPLSRALRPLLVRLAWIAFPRQRAAIRATSRVVLGSGATSRDVDRHARRVMRNIQDFIADVATIDRRSVSELAARSPEWDGVEQLVALVDAQRPVILASAHLGSFESAIAALRSVSAVPVHVVYARDSIGAFDRARSRARGHLGIVEQPVDRGLESWLALRDALGRGEIVTILADRCLPGQRGRWMPFLGRRGELPTGPVRLAALTGAPIIPTFSIPRPDGLATLRFEPAIEVANDGRPVDEHHPAQQALVRAMERAIRAAPEHWLVVDGPWARSESAES